MLNKENIQDIYKLSPPQLGIYFHVNLNESSGPYYNQITIDINGALNIPHVKEALGIVIKTYDVLRTVFVNKYEDVLQVVLRDYDADIEYFDLSSSDDKTNLFEKYKKEDKLRGLKLDQEIQIRVTVFKLQDCKFKLLFGVNHIILDGWSTSIVIQHFINTYLSLNKGEKVEINNVPQFGEYIDWLERQDEKKGSSFWSQYLSGFEKATGLSFLSCVDDSVSDYDLVSYSHDFSQKTGDIIKFCAQHKLTINNFFQACWAILLAKYNSTSDVVFGITLSIRPPEIPQIERVVGLLINTIPIRITTKPGDSVLELLQEIKENNLQLDSYSHYSLPKIQSLSEPKQALIDNILIFENYPIINNNGNVVGRETKSIIGGIDVSEQTNYDINLYIIPNKSLIAKFDFNQNRYSLDTVKGISAHLNNIINQILVNNELEIRQIEIISHEEKEVILSKFNRPVEDIRFDDYYPDLFDRVCAENPDRIALIFEEENISYGELKKQSEILQIKLKKYGVGENCVVGVLLKREIEVVISLLAILKSNGTFLPIDLNNPTERITEILSSGTAKVLITNRTLLNEYKDIKFNGTLLYCCEELKSGERNNISALTSKRDGKNIAYLMFTSGSTGAPKGIAIPYENLNVFMKGMAEKISFTQDEVILSLTSISFDIFFMEMLMPLVYGMKVILANEDSEYDSDKLLNIIEKNSITKIQMTPSRVQMLLKESNLKNRLKSVREIIIGGEELPKEILSRVQQVTDNKIFNVYGPTEATIWVSIKDVSNVNKITIGKPISNTHIYILNSDMQIQSVDIPGELYIGGDSLALGYWNNDELTKQKFVLDPFNEGKRIYKSGDLARWNENGEVEFLGRIDSQLKLRGYRIEPKEIEENLEKHKYIFQSKVLIKKDKSNNKVLAAYVLLSNSGKSENKAEIEKELRKFLINKIPFYMVPKYFIPITKFPLTISNKIDLKKLASIDIKNDVDIELNRFVNWTATEVKIYEIWKEILQKYDFDRNDNFFEIGGDSITAISLHKKLNEIFPKEISMGLMFKNLTITFLADYYTSDNDGNFDSSLIRSKKILNNKVKILRHDTNK